MTNIGFMQGRLSPLIDGKIQAFPWPYWQEEFALAQIHEWHVIEWTLDYDRLYENPVMTAKGREQIRKLCVSHDCRVPSLTGDFFMQQPFFKHEGIMRQRLLDDLKRVLESCADVGIRLVMLPLVDNGSIMDDAQGDALYEGLMTLQDVLRAEGMKISFESDFDPESLAGFIELFDEALFGITYDIGNSASLGYDFEVELAAYYDHIDNVHVKDRLLGGTTVPLGSGQARLPQVLGKIYRRGYLGNYILQTARAENGNHAGVLNHYRNQVNKWLEKASYESSSVRS